jgi:transcription elongation regulator 1
MLREKCPNVDRHTRWAEVKRKIESEPTYVALEWGNDREEVFHDYLREMRAKEKEREKEKEKEREVSWLSCSQFSINMGWY